MRIEEGVHQRLGMGRGQNGRVMVERLKRAVAAHEGRRTDAEMNVGGARHQNRGAGDR